MCRGNLSEAADTVLACYGNGSTSARLGHAMRLGCFRAPEWCARPSVWHPLRAGGGFVRRRRSSGGDLPPARRPVRRRARPRCARVHATPLRRVKARGSIALARSIEKSDLKMRTSSPKLEGPEGIGRSAGRATPVAAPAPLGSNRCFRRDADIDLRVADPDGIDIGSAVKPGRRLQATWPGFLLVHWEIAARFPSDLISAKRTGKAGSSSQGGLRCMLLRAVRGGRIWRRWHGRSNRGENRGVPPQGGFPFP
jgi:hypothetical protein